MEFYFFYTRIPLVFPGFPAWNCHLGSCWKSGIAQDFMDASKHLELRGFYSQDRIIFHGFDSVQSSRICFHGKSLLVPFIPKFSGSLQFKFQENRMNSQMKPGKKTNEKSKPELRNSQIHLSSFPGISSQQVLLRKTGILSQLEFPWRKTELSQLLLLDFLWNFPGKQQNSQGSRAHFPWISPLKQNFGSSFFPTFPS